MNISADGSVSRDSRRLSKVIASSLGRYRRRLNELFMLTPAEA